MTIKPSLLKKIVCSAWLLVMSSVVHAGWSGYTTIGGMYIYPNYAVIIQGNVTGGPASCVNDGTWSFDWSSFPAATQQRIMSMLMTAYTAKQRISVLLSDTSCGPEGKKKFTGEVNF
jgi:hypothetical protein